MKINIFFERFEHGSIGVFYNSKRLIYEYVMWFFWGKCNKFQGPFIFLLLAYIYAWFCKNVPRLAQNKKRNLGRNCKNICFAKGSRNF